MAEKIFIGKISKGMEQYFLPFNIDNDAFPTLYNAYAWRGRVKRKRGTTILGRLEFQVELAAMPNNWQYPQFALVAGAGNLLTAIGESSPATITPGSIDLSIGGQTYTEPTMPDGTLMGSGGGTGTINYSTGAITITGGGVSEVTGTYAFFPSLPVMGLEDYVSGNSQYPLLLAFDTVYAYQLLQITNQSPSFYNVSYYKHSDNPVTWSGQNYQQFWTTNYQGALWAVNNNPGMRIAWVHSCADQMSTTITMVLYNQADNAALTTLVVNDYLFFNEGTAATTWTLNGQTGYVSNATGAATGTYVITFTTTQTSTGYNADTAIAQLLTNQSTGTGDGIRWYDGDPTGGTGLPTMGNTTGWVNFSPPLTAANTVTIDDHVSSGPYYLVGALIVVPFKDRLLFFAPYLQTSTGAKSGANPIQINDGVIWSWNGTPYYSSLTPAGQTYDVTAYYVDQTGKGGWLSSGLDQNLTSVNNNEDVLIVGFTGKQTRFVYTSDDFYPFLFFIVNSEYGTSSTFSTISLDRGVLSYGQFGFIVTAQVGSQRIDLQIPNQAFYIGATLSNQDAARISAVRDYYHEWVHFTFTPNNSQWSFPTQTFQYNYREETWALFYENYTTQGLFRRQQGFTWANNPWNSTMTPWNGISDTWESGGSTSLFPSVTAGNPEGFVVVKNDITGEAQTGAVVNITDASGFAQITSYNHCVSATNGPLGDGGDYLYFFNALNLLSSSITAISQADPCVITTANSFAVDDYVTITGVMGMTELNGNTYQIIAASGASITINVDSTNFSAYSSSGTVTSAFNNLVGRVIEIVDSNNFVVNIPTPTFAAGGYLGMGVFSRLSQPLIQTKQFPVYWNEGRKVRVGNQKYLFDYTEAGQVSLFIYLSQDPDDAWNNFPVVPQFTNNNSLIYSTVLYTCPESTNIGLTEITESLNNPNPISGNQYQIWHRVNTSLIGDTFQLGITLNDPQMKSLTTAIAEIALHAIQIDVGRGPLVS